MRTHLLILLALAACNRDEQADVVPHEEVSTAKQDVAVVDLKQTPVAATPTSGAPEPIQPQSGVPAASGDPSLFAYDTPAGWEEIPPEQFRNPNFIIDGNPDAQVYVTVLRGGGGSVQDNLNRWRGQMGQPALSPEEIEALPRIILLDVVAPLLDLSGTFNSGTMSGGGESRPNFRLVGTALELPNGLVTVKMIGPVSALEHEWDTFHDFVASLRQTELPQGHPPLTQ